MLGSTVTEVDHGFATGDTFIGQVVIVQDADHYNLLDSVGAFRDADGNGTLEAGIDNLLGTDTDGGDGWSIATSTAGFSLGVQSYFAQATDNEGLTSDAAIVTGAVEASAPVVSAYASTDVPIAINSTDTFTSTLDITDAYTILDINVDLNITL